MTNILSAKPTSVYMRQWRTGNQAQKIKEGIHHRSKYQLYKSLVFELLGGKCSVCKFDDVRALQIDHVNGDGFKDRRSNGNSGYGYPFLKRILEDEDAKSKYQILCANHNWIKRHENNEGRRRKSIAA